MTSDPRRESHGVDFLLSNQNPDGGWGYHAAAPSAVEATAWALTALLSWGGAPAPGEACARARDWLLQARCPDGSWPAFPGQPQGCWTTSVACRALWLQGGAEAAVEGGLHWLLKAWPSEGTVWRRWQQTLFPSRALRQNNALRGWNWTPGTASWVEPTSLALLFLRALRPDALPPLAVKRRRLAERLLYDRMCPGGGWNSGNPLVYGVAGVPRIGPTVWALLALRDQSHRAEVQMSLRYLAGAYSGIQGAASLALAHRCLRVYGQRLPPLAPALGELYFRNRFFENVLTTAWVVLALAEEGSASARTAEGDVTE